MIASAYLKMRQVLVLILKLNIVIPSYAEKASNSVVW